MKQINHSLRSSYPRGFSLIEVVLALGVFLVTILALVGLLGPSLKSINEIENTDEVSSVVNTLNAFLQNSPAIATTGSDPKSKFEVIYENVASGGEATVFVFRRYLDSDQDSFDTRIFVGFASGETVGDNSASVDQDDFQNAAGTIYRCVLSASPVTPSAARSAARDGNGIYTLSSTNVDNYDEGYFAMEIRIFAEEPPGPNGSFNDTTDLAALVNEDPIFSYNTAIVR